MLSAIAALTLVVAQPAPARAPAQPLPRAGAAPASAGAPVSTTPVLEQCLVTLLRDVPAPAQEAGLLVEVNVREGDMVTAGTVLARINDSHAQAAKRVAEFEKSAAEEKAKSDIEVSYSKAAQAIAATEYDKARLATQRAANAVTAVDLDRLKLTAERAGLQIIQAELQRRIDAITAQAKGAELEAAEDAIARREIRATFDGQVVEVKRQAGEWVQPGETVVRVIRVDKLRVEGYANINQHRAADLDGKPVQVEVDLGTGRTARFAGRVVFVDPRVQAAGRFRVVAEVDNREEDGEWLLRSGLNAAMAIDTTAPVNPSAAVSNRGTVRE